MNEDTDAQRDGGCLPRLVSRKVAKSEVRSRWQDYVGRVFVPGEYREEELSESGWLLLFGMGSLMENSLQNGDDNGNRGEADGDPAADGVRPPSASLKFVMPYESLPQASFVVKSSNPFANLLVGLAAKLIRICGFHIQIFPTNADVEAPPSGGVESKQERETK